LWASGGFWARIRRLAGLQGSDWVASLLLLDFFLSSFSQPPGFKEKRKKGRGKGLRGFQNMFQTFLKAEFCLKQFTKI
jgi:hypothetical protein